MTEKTISQRCGVCRFYNKQEETTHNHQTEEPLNDIDYEAECRRFPPLRGDSEYYGRLGDLAVLCEGYGWPTVNAMSWCGEWKSR